VSSIDVIDPAYFAKEAKGLTAPVEEWKEVARRVKVPRNEVDHDFDDKEDGQVETESDCEGGDSKPRERREAKGNKRGKSRSRYF